MGRQLGAINKHIEVFIKCVSTELGSASFVDREWNELKYYGVSTIFVPNKYYHLRIKVFGYEENPDDFTPVTVFKNMKLIKIVVKKTPA